VAAAIAPEAASTAAPGTPAALTYTAGLPSMAPAAA
jgi:hypothetical protein